MSGGECVKVIVRCRPMNGKEKALHCAKIVNIDQNALAVSITKPRILGSELAAGQTSSSKSTSEATDYEPKRFTYDGVYDDDSNQKEVYEDTAYPLLQSVMEGYNGTIFAYGQTGCGKTFTMEGVRSVPELRGIIPTTFNQLFTSIDAAADGQKQFLVRASYIEIYNEEVRDLMSDNPKARCEVKEDKDKGVYIKGLINSEVKCEADLESVMSRGNSNRTVGATLMNADSSRSHSIFTITIECSEPDTVKGGDEVKIRQGKLNLVDLAGSERQSKTQAEGVRLKEATKINLSLSALGNVIEALVANAGGKGRHIPYRDSKLTRLLQDSLGGNTKTVMIAAISPADYNFDETLSTLRYANRAKNIKNKPVINEDPKDALLREYQDEIKRLKLILEEKGLGDLLSSMTKLTGGAPAKTSAATKAPSSASSSKKATVDVEVSKEDTAEAVAIALTGAKSEKRAAAHEEFEEDLNRLSDEKHQHERLAAVIGLEMESRAQEVAEIVKEKTEIEHRIEAEAAKGKTEVVALLQQEKERLEVESSIKQQEQTDIQQRMMDEKQEHESMALSLQQEMQQRLEEEAQRRQELEMKYNFIQDKTEKEKQLLEQKLQLLQTKLLKGSHKIKNIQQEQQEEKLKIKLKEKDMKRQALLLKEQQLQYEENSLFIEEKYNNIQEANDSISRKLRLIAKKYRGLEQEKLQLEDELEQSKEIHIRDIREADKETKLYRQIVYLLLTETDIDKIVKNAEWLDGREQWKLPAIDLPLIFPSIHVASKQLSLPSHKTQSPNATTTSNQSPRQQQKPQSQERAKSRWGNKSPLPADVSQQQQTISSIPPSARPMSNSIMSRLHLHDYRSYEQNALDRSLYSTAPHAISMGATPSWRKSAAISRLSSEELESMARERAEHGRQQSRPRTNTSISVAEASQKAAELTENLENITAAVRRREAFQPTKMIEETKEEYEADDDDHNKNKNNSIVNDIAIKKRPAFQPAKIITNMEKDIPATTLLPDSAFNVPSRPAFNPTSPTPTSPATPGGTTLDINNLPKGRGAFTPAKLA